MRVREEMSVSDGVREFAGSELFERTFDEGMELVEQAAAYLDGEGRQASKLLSRNAAMAYAGESMRLTTRLMQVASWLLVQRAVREGNMTAQAAREPRYRVGASQPSPHALAEGEALPAPLLFLAERSERLYARVANLDRRMYGEAAGGEGQDANAVLSQFERLRRLSGPRPCRPTWAAAWWWGTTSSGSSSSAPAGPAARTSTRCPPPASCSSTRRTPPPCPSAFATGCCWPPARA